EEGSGWRGRVEVWGDRPADDVAVDVENADRVTLQDRRRVHVLGHLEAAERDAGDRTQIKAADALAGVTRRGFAAVVDNHAAVLFKGLFDHRAAHGEIGAFEPTPAVVAGD